MKVLIHLTDAVLPLVLCVRTDRAVNARVERRIHGHVRDIPKHPRERETAVVRVQGTQSRDRRFDDAICRREMHQIRPSLRSSVTEVEVGVVGTHRPEFGEAAVSAESPDSFSGSSFDYKEPVARRRSIVAGYVRT